MLDGDLGSRVALGAGSFDLGLHGPRRQGCILARNKTEACEQEYYKAELLEQDGTPNTHGAIAD
jgi:hypothetical protein